MSDKISIAPVTNILRAQFESNLGWRNAIGELVDNALDAHASLARITFGRKRFVVFDDGDGCVSPEVLVRAGDRIQHKGKPIGRYGIGAKESVMWIGGESSRVAIWSVCGGQRRELRVDWSEVLRSGTWEINRPTVMAASTSERGTEVAIDRPARMPPHGAAWAELLADLGYMYTPALKRGRQIVVTGLDGIDRPLERFEFPTEMADRIDVTIDVGGRKARVYAGIVPSGVANPRPGLTYEHGLRVIKPASGYGCGGLDFGRICGFVDLTDGWVLTKNKDDVSRHADELYAAVFDVLQDMLRKAEAISHTLESAQFVTNVEGILNAMIANPDAKAVRGKGDKSGTENPTGKGKRHRRAREEQDGATFCRRRLGAVRVSIVDWPDQRIGAFSPPNTIQLNRTHAGISHLLRTRNRDATAYAALGILVAAETMSDGKQTILGPMQDHVSDPAERFNRRFGELTCKPLALDGRDVLSGEGPTATSPGGDAE